MNEKQKVILTQAHLLIPYANRIRALYLFISEPEMHLCNFDGSTVLDRMPFYHKVRAMPDEAIVILWQEIQKRIPDSCIDYFLFGNGGYIAEPGFYYRMGLYYAHGYPWKEMQFFYEQQIDDNAPVPVMTEGEA